MNNEPVLQRLIGRIYDAATDSSMWPSILEDIADGLGANSGVLYVVNTDTGDLDHMSTARLDPGTISLAAHDDYRPLDVFNDLYRQLPENQIITRHGLLPDREYTNNAFYEDILRPCKIWHILGEHPLREGSSAVTIGFHRSRRQENFTETEFHTYRQLSRHIKGSMRLWLRMKELERQRDIVVNALDHLPMGVILIDGEGRVLQMNHAARNLVAEADGLTIDRFGACRTAQSDETALLDKLIGITAQTGAGRATTPGGTMRISRPSGLRPYSLLAVPLAGERHPDTSPSAAAALFVSDPESTPRMPSEILTGFYGLTEKESRMTLLLLQGMKLKDAADELSITDNTARTHLKRIFHKIGVNRQSELIRTILSGPAMCASIKKLN